jgi:hypothetical protein
MPPPSVGGVLASVLPPPPLPPLPPLPPPEQAPALQLCPLLHSLPQPPQFLLSLLVSVQVPLQLV